MCVPMIQHNITLGSEPEGLGSAINRRRIRWPIGRPRVELGLGVRVGSGFKSEHTDAETSNTVELGCDHG